MKYFEAKSCQVDLFRSSTDASFNCAQQSISVFTCDAAGAMSFVVEWFVKKMKSVWQSRPFVDEMWMTFVGLDLVTSYRFNEILFLASVNEAMLVTVTTYIKHKLAPASSGVNSIARGHAFH